MQKEHYDTEASKWTVDDRDHVVGSFDFHNLWEGYKHLFEGMTDLDQKLCLDFGCGTGRNISKYYDTFKRIDGVDISTVNLMKATDWLNYNNQTNKHSILYPCNGVDLNQISDSAYDIVMSTITMQHICVWEIRYNYFKEFYRVLKPGGMITVQMGYGYSDNQPSVDYSANNYEALATNGQCDVCITASDVMLLGIELSEIGFKDFSYTVDTAVPGDRHPQAIYFRATK